MKIEEVKKAYTVWQPMSITITINDISPRIRRLERLFDEFYEDQTIGTAVRAGDYAGHLIADSLESGIFNYIIKKGE